MRRGWRVKLVRVVLRRRLFVRLSVGWQVKLIRSIKRLQTIITKEKQILRRFVMIIGELLSVL